MIDTLHPEHIEAVPNVRYGVDLIYVAMGGKSEGNRKGAAAAVRSLTTEDVWDTVFFSGAPKSLNREKLWKLYVDAGADCPIIKSPDSSPCASGRFGCWTCTVVRRDKSGENLLSKGYDEMSLFLAFRQLLLTLRNDPAMRWPERRTGKSGPGPMSISARRILKAAIENIEKKLKTRILSAAELDYIARQWSADRQRDQSYAR